MTSLEPLARAVAASWATSTVAPGVSSALQKLLPGLTYASVAVCNPHQRRWSLVGASNLAAGAQLELLLLDPQQSAAGLALRTGKLVQSSFHNGTNQFSLQLGDVVSMLQAEPEIKFMLCLPFKSAASRDQHNSALEGALLLGIKHEYQVSKRQLATLLMLAQLLPTALSVAARVTSVLDTVDFMMGAAPYQCPCCLTDDDGEDSEPEEEEDNGPCSDDDKRNPPHHPQPAQPLLVTSTPTMDVYPAPDDDGSDGECPRCSSNCNCNGGLAAEACGSGSAAATATDANEAARSSSSRSMDVCMEKVGMRWEESTGEMSTTSSLELDENGRKMQRARACRAFEVTTQERHPVWISFVDPLLESEFLKWHSRHHIKIDRLFLLLLLVALCIVGFCHPFKLVDRNPWGLLLGWLLLAPLIAVLDKKAYASRRERVVVVMRLLLVAFINLVSIPTYQSYVVDENLSMGPTFWMLTGTESLLITALGLQVRFWLQAPLQFACMALTAWHMPSMCAVCYPGLTATMCQAHGMRLLVGAGVILPLAVLRVAESKSRDAFLQELRAEPT